MRNKQEVEQYLTEAFDKVWLMRAHESEDPELEAQIQEQADRIFETYADIPDDGYTDWDCGYWNGILAALRWVLGEDKDFLDT
jgi:hypothetical protein